MAENSGRTLSSWKEIAAHLGRDERTVRRWETERSLPVHRGPKGKGHSVYAYTSELDQWLHSGAHLQEAGIRETPQALPGRFLPSSRRRAAILLLTAALVGAVGYSAKSLHRPAAVAQAGRTMIVVLPFANLSGNPQDDYLSDGLTEEIISQLGGLSPGRLGVIARTSAMTYKSTKKNVAEIGNELHVNYVVEGSIRQSGNRARITAQLIRTGDQTHLWAESYDREPGEILAMERDLAQAIVTQVRLQVGAEGQKWMNNTRAPSAPAHEAYLKGRYLWNKRTAEDLRKSVGFFQEAIKAEPDYAIAFAGLADSYLVMSGYGVMSPQESYPLAKAAAEKALQLDETLAEAHATLASVKGDYERDWNGAEREYRRAITLNPAYASAHQWYSGSLSAMGRHDEAIAEIQRGLELDPLSLIINANAGTAYYAARRHDEAIQQLKKTLEIEPRFAYAHSRLGFAYQEKGMLREALAEFQKALELSDGQPTFLAGQGTTYALMGRKRDAEQIANKMVGLMKQRYVSPFALALVYARLDRKEEAFRWLQRASESGDDNLIFLNVEPTFDGLRTDPRFHELLHKMNLEAARGA